MIAVHHGDCTDIIPTLGMTVDAVVTDPPYHLVQMAERSQYPIKSAVMKRFTKGFMGTAWDGGDIAFQPETWRIIGSVMRPGAFLCAFGGTRTYHRMTSAIEDAGFVIQDCIFWLYGSGFPKRRDMLKPAVEPVVLAYKPGGKRTLQADECRIPTQGRPLIEVTGGLSGGVTFHQNESGGSSRCAGTTDIGRWPANLCHDGSDEVMEAFPESAGRQGYVRGTEPSECHSGVYSGPRGRHQFAPRNDTGSAARFFYTAKADRHDRFGSRHPTVKPVSLIEWLVKLVTPPGGTVLDPFAGSGTTAVAALAAGRNAILIEREDQYIADIRERVAFYEGEGRHSVVAKNRSRSSSRETMPLFERPYDETADAKASFLDAIKAIGDRVKAGEPVPTTGYFGPSTATGNGSQTPKSNSRTPTNPNYFSGGV